MKRLAFGHVPALAGILATFDPSYAVGAEEACAGLRLEVDPAMERRYPELAESVSAAFLARDDTDACPRVRLSLAEQAIKLEVALSDGRSTVRSLARPDDVVPTLQALVIVPERDEAAAIPKARAAAAASRQAKRARAEPRRSRPPATPRAGARSDDQVSDRGLVPAPDDAVEPSAVRIELSSFLGAHVGENGGSSLNFGVSTLLDIHRFLGGLQLRVDQYQGMEEGRGEAFELALLLGRRFDLDMLGLDLTLGPSAAFRGSSALSEDVAASANRSMTTTTITMDDEKAAYACLAARGSLFQHSALRPFLAADAAFRLDEREPGVAAVFPDWAFGVSLGVTVGTL